MHYGELQNRELTGCEDYFARLVHKEVSFKKFCLPLKLTSCPSAENVEKPPGDILISSLTTDKEKLVLTCQLSDVFHFLL